MKTAGQQIGEAFTEGLERAILTTCATLERGIYHRRRIRLKHRLEHRLLKLERLLKARS